MKRIICIGILSMMLCTTALAAEETDALKINNGTDRAAVHDILGEPLSESVYGYKEVYSLDSGKQAVLNYIDDIFEFGFILLNP